MSHSTSQSTATELKTSKTPTTADASPSTLDRLVSLVRPKVELSRHRSVYSGRHDRPSDSRASGTEDLPPSDSPPSTPPSLLHAWLNHYRTPAVQLFLVSLISFLCPGMFNALNGIGGGGLDTAKAVNTANVALYSTFSVAGFFAGIFINKLGIRVTLCIGCFGYALYTASLLCYKQVANDGFLIFAGLQLGVCAGVFWAAQGMMTISYPREGTKGKSIGWFWGIYNMGAVIGSVIALIQNLRSLEGAATDFTFYALILLSVLGSALSLFLTPPSRVVRSDGTHVTLPDTPTWKSSFLELFSALHSDYHILLLFPMFFASNIFYPYQFNTFNLAHFTIRTRSLNNVMYWISEIGAGYFFGCALDCARARRAIRARVALIVLGLLTCAVWSGALVWEMDTPNLVKEENQKIDFTDRGYIYPMLLYMSCGLLAAAYQTCLYWFLGALTTDSRKIANLAGFYKGVQSAGGAVSFRVNLCVGSSTFTPISELVMCWSVLLGSLVVAAPLIVRKVKDHERTVEATPAEMTEREV